MADGLAIAMAVALWLYSLVVLRNGGGAVSSLALILTFAVHVVAAVWFLETAQFGLFAALIAAFFAAFWIVIMCPDRDFID